LFQLSKEIHRYQERDHLDLPNYASGKKLYVSPICGKLSETLEDYLARSSVEIVDVIDVSDFKLLYDTGSWQKLLFPST